MPTTGFDIKRLAGAGLTIAALSLGMSACGGGNDDEPAPTATATTGVTEVATITTEELISQGDEICAEVNAAIGSIDGSTADETTKSSQREGIYDGLATSLSGLGTPSDGEPPTDVIDAAQELGDGSTDVTAFQTAASEYGFTECAEAPAIPTVTSGTETDTGVDTGTEETYVPPTTTVPEETYVPPTTTPSTGGGVAPAPPVSGGTGGSSSGGSSSGGIGPG